MRGMITLPAPSLLTFAAIDFETANQDRNSACSVGLVLVERGRITERFHSLIKPPSSYFKFTSIHGISGGSVRSAPSFAQLWPDLERLLRRAHFLAAHNAPFDRSVLEKSCSHAGLVPPAQEFLCTVKLARSRWGLSPARLPDVARHLGLTLRHHDAMSDAETCARIVLHAAGAASNLSLGQ